MRPIPNTRSFWVLAAVWAGLLPFYAVWLVQDHVVAPWDMSIHAGLAYDIWHELARLRVFAIYSADNYYPPLFHLIASPLTLISSAPDVYCAANWLFLFLTMWATWLVGRELWGESAGVFAGALVPACVYVGWMCIMPMTDLCLAATVAWTVWVLMRTPRLQDGRQAHVVGVLIGLGMLAKWTYPFFAAVPIAIYLVRNFRERRNGFGRRLAIVIGWTVLIAGPWYAHSLPHMVHKIGPQLGGAVAQTEGDPSVFSIASLTRYAWYLGHDYFRWPLVALVGGGFVVSMWRLCRTGQNRGFKLLVVISAVVSGWAILTLISNKDPRYIMPLVPLMIAASVGWVELTRFKTACIAGVVAIAFVMTGWSLFVNHPPLRGSTGVEEMAEWMLEHTTGSKHAKAVVIPDEWNLNASALDYALHRRDAKSRATRGKQLFDDKHFVPSDRFIITLDTPNKNTGISPHEVENTQYVKKRVDWMACKSFARFDGKQIQVWKHR